MKPYNDYSSYLKERYGCKVYRIGIDAGFSCPNRNIDGGGCAYCNGSGSRSSYTDPKLSVEEQIHARIEYLKPKKDVTKFIAYFQAFTNTYGPIAKLKTIYDNVLPFREIVGISIGTRPDTVDREKIKLIASYLPKYEIWLELGLQSAHDKTLKEITRGHTFKDFEEAVALAKEYKIKLSAHVILGLPGETREDMIETACAITKLKIDGVKIHVLHILKGSKFEKLYREDKIKTLEQDEYARLACDFLENLSPRIVIQRLTGQGSGTDHIAPMWAFDKIGTINKIEEFLRSRNSYQGKAIS